MFSRAQRMSKTALDINKQDEEVCRDAKKFVDLFFDAMDRKRDKIGFFYSSDTSFLWNGNPLQGSDAVCKFMMVLPATKHELAQLDAQRLPDVPNRPPSLLLTTTGNMTLGEADMHAFSQTLLLVYEDNKYKVKTHRVRFVD